MLDKHTWAADIMDKEKAKELLRDYARNCLHLTKHCKERMALRDVSFQDINWVIMWGNVIVVEWSAEYQNYKCTVRGKDLDDDELTFIGALDEKTESVICLTVE